MGLIRARSEPISMVMRRDDGIITSHLLTRSQEILINNKNELWKRPRNFARLANYLCISRAEIVIGILARMNPNWSHFTQFTFKLLHFKTMTSMSTFKIKTTKLKLTI